MNPAAFGLDIVGKGSCYQVVRHGRVLPARYSNRDSALYSMTNIARRLAEAQRPLIPCLCCATPFRSEGRHNRLCNDCRRNA